MQSAHRLELLIFFRKIASSTISKDQDLGNSELVLRSFYFVSVDNSWYRASILKLYPDKTAQVEFVDFGNTELVPLSMIRPITNDYVELPILAFKCCLSGK